MHPFRTALAGLLFLSALSPSMAGAASHQWRFTEAFSNADGTVQFIEMKECCGFASETLLNNKWLQAVNAGRQYVFGSNLSGNTANKHLLIATQGFADLPGAPAPDYVLPDGFLPLEGETLEYWMYSNATWTYAPLPTDGVTSMNANGSTGINSPTNFAGESGSVNAGVPVEVLTWGRVKASNFRIVLR